MSDPQASPEALQQMIASEIAKGIAAALPGIREHLKAELAAERADEATVSPRHFTNDRFGGEKFAEDLAVAIAQLSDQGTGRGKRVAPEILAMRSKAHEAMVAKLEEVHLLNLKPLYTLRAKTYINEMLIEPFWKPSQQAPARPTQIEYRGIPNEVMVPVNEIAREIHALFLDSIGHVATPRAHMAEYITAAGIVVNGTVAPSRRQPHNIVTDAIEGRDALRVLDQQAIHPGETIRVLGTVMPAALAQA